MPVDERIQWVNETRQFKKKVFRNQLGQTRFYNADVGIGEGSQSLLRIGEGSFTNLKLW